MAYVEKYQLSFVSERGNDYKIVILQKGFAGAVQLKKLGVAPALSIEEGDGRIKGSSLAFSIQADVDGELSGLYTTNNKEFKVLLYRNDSLYWQGYLLPELYSENYVDAPYDVAVTATDQLATLKSIAYSGADVQSSLYEIIDSILAQTQLPLSCNLHLQLNAAGQQSFLRETYISAAAYNGQSCYDALNTILSSCNACIMQIGNQWLITSLTNNSTSYDVNGVETTMPHFTIGQMHSADVWPDGSLNMINAPALKGATVEYSHILRNSLLKNADCVSKDDWQYTISDSMDLQYPMEFTAYSKVYKAYAWRLSQKNVQEDYALQLWQDVKLNADAQTTYKLSFDYLMAPRAVMLLLSIVHIDNNGVTRMLTADGWKTDVLSTDTVNYIQVTGEPGNNQLTSFDVANKEAYERATVKFVLPDASGTLRVGFINTTIEGNAPATNNDEIYVSRVYLTIDGITGKTATTEVEKNATSAQEEVMLSYGDAADGANAGKIVLNTLRDAQGAELNTWYLSGRQFLSYYNAMLQEFSRYYGSKRMQLQGSIMGKNLLHPYYKDTYSGKVMMLLNGQYNLLEDTLSLTIEEVTTTFVDFDTVVYATDNRQQNTSGIPGSTTAIGGSTKRVFGLNEATEEEKKDAYVMIDNYTFPEPRKMHISQVNLWELKNIGTEEEPSWAVMPKTKDGKKVGIISETFLTFGGKKKPTEEEMEDAKNGIRILNNWEDYDEKARMVLSSKLGMELKNRLFIGTQEQYDEQNEFGAIPKGTIVIILEELEYQAMLGLGNTEDTEEI